MTAMTERLTRRRLTLDEFLRLPERKPALEYEHGEVTQKVAPKARHSVLQSMVVEFINTRTRQSKIAFAFSELRSTFAGLSRVPDVSIYRWGRVPRDPDGRITNDIFEPPDIAIEIISPGQGVNRLVRRCISFVEAGVVLAVLIDPEDESVLTIRTNSPPAIHRRGDILDLSLIVPELNLDPAALFDALRF